MAGSQGGNTFPWSFDERNRRVFSDVDSSRIDSGTGGRDVAAASLAFALRRSARAMISLHLRPSLAFSTEEVAR